MAKHIILILLSLSCSNIFAQDEIDADRPDQAESATVTPKGFFQAEFGFNIEKDGGLNTFVHPAALWKYGINKRFELRLITEFISQETPITIPQGNKFITGILPVQIGTRVALWEEKGALPKTSLLFHVGIPAFSSSAFKPPHVTTAFRISMAHSLSENIGLGYNFGAEWDGYDNTPEWIYTFAPGIGFCKDWYGYIEAFGAFKKNEPARHNIDGGLAYLISDNTRVDISSGFGISKNAVDHYVSIGFSFRVDTKKKQNSSLH